MPRMTTLERNAIQTPEEGLMIFNTDRQSMQFYRKNVGLSNSLTGWYDTRCQDDISEALITLGNGIVLDFSTQDEFGKFFPQINGGGTAFTSSTADGTNFRSIGPIPSDITNTSSAPVYINWVSTGAESPNPFVFNNTDEANEYNASNFLSRTAQISNAFTGMGDKIVSDPLTPYYGDIDVVLVARRIGGGSGPNLSSFFSTGPKNVGFQIGMGNNQGGGPCTWNHFTLNFAERLYICGGNARRVLKDENFHRFRVKYDASTRKVSFYIDGKIIQNVTLSLAQITRNNGAFHNIIQELKLFKGTDDSDKRQFRGSIAFLGIYTTHLTDSDFEVLDKYLECKFETQP